jgi:hypothetical protein
MAILLSYALVIGKHNLTTDKKGYTHLPGCSGGGIIRVYLYTSVVKVP